MHHLLSLNLVARPGARGVGRPMKANFVLWIATGLVLILSVSCLNHQSGAIRSCPSLDNEENPEILKSWLQEEVAPSELKGKPCQNLTGGSTLEQILGLLRPGDKLIHYKAPKSVKLNDDYMISTEGYALVRQCKIIAFFSTEECMLFNDVE
jgi:hypothetical protein